MHAALLHRCLKGATCGLLFCFHLTRPSSCYLWLLLIDIDIVKNISIDNKVVLSNELAGIGEVSDLPLQLQTASLQCSERKAEFFVHQVAKWRSDVLKTCRKRSVM